MTIIKRRSCQFFFDVLVFLLSSLVTGPSSISIPLLVLKLGQFLLIRDWPEIWKSEIPSCIFWPISGDWEKLGILYLVIMYLIKSYWILQNVRVTAFSVSKFLRENQQRVGGGINPQPQIRVNRASFSMD